MTEDKSVFEICLGPAFHQLPPALKHLHSGHARWRGRSSVLRGRSPMARLLAASFRFPPAAEDVQVEVNMRREGMTEHWSRSFGKHRFVSHLTPDSRKNGRIWERFGPFTFAIDLDATDTSLSYPVARGVFLGVPIPGMLLPASDTVERVDEVGRPTFDVSISHPLAGLVVRYQGWLEPVAP